MGRIILAIGCIAVVLLLAWIFLRHQILPKRLVEVEAGRLYRSGQLEAHLLRPTLSDLDIQVVLDLTFGDPPELQAIERRIADEMGIEYVNIPLHANGLGDVNSYARAVQVVAKAMDDGETILVHCSAGSRRTGGVVSLYEVLVEGRPAPEVYAELDRFGARPVSESALLPFLNENMAGIAEALVQAGLIGSVPSPIPHFDP